MLGKLLVIDDEEYIGWVIKKAFEVTEEKVSLCFDGKSGLLEIQKENYDLVFLDLRLPDIDGMDLLLELKKLQPNLAVIIITAHGSIDTAIECMKRGAFDYITKPFDIDELLLQAKKVTEMGKLKEEVKYLRSEMIKEVEESKFLSKNEVTSSIFKSINQLAETTATVLIAGESGTGKELLARRIHQLSDRKNNLFIASRGDGVTDTELFGNEKSSFLGASQKKLGKFELADKGTIFLDEIGEMSLNVQGKLLRVLQEKEFQRVGGNSNIKVDVRIIATTSINLMEAIEEGKFREDLFYRLNVIPIELPPLRDRTEDISDLVYYFIKKYDTGAKIEDITVESMKLLKNYHWPGNIRELENVIERIIILNDSKIIKANILPVEILGQKKNLREPIIYFPEEGINLETVEKELILKALNLSGQNQSKAALLLSITRSALIYRMQKYHIN